MKRTMSPEQAVFLKYYEAYNDAIFRFCLTKVRNRDLALDITQDTFIKTWSYLQKGNTVENMRAFLYRIAHNNIIDAVRKKREESLDSILESGLDFESQRELKDMHNQADMTLALQILDTLEPATKELLIMRFLDGLSVKEIAELLDQEANTISVRIHRALESIQKRSTPRQARGKQIK